VEELERIKAQNIQLWKWYEDMLKRVEALEAIVNKPKKSATKVAPKGAVQELKEFDKYLKTVTVELQQEWLMRFKLPFIKEEFNKATLWCVSKPAQAPKSNYGAFFTRWLMREASKNKEAYNVSVSRMLVIPMGGIDDQPID
jgi:hypothetical protein